MSSYNSHLNNFLNKEKGNITTFFLKNQYSKNALNKLNSLDSSNKINKTRLYNIDNNYNNFIYREEYIPKRINYYSSFENNSNNYLGRKQNRNKAIEFNNNKINLPNDKRYHKSLLQTSLEKIRNEIKQKRLENSIRMNELNNKTDYLNDYFKNNNNKGKYTGAGIFTNKIEIENNNKFNNNIDLQEKEINKNMINTNFNFKKTKTIDNDLICNDINESFTIFSNKEKKVEPQTFFISQRQNEFTYNNIYSNNNIIQQKENENKNKSLFNNNSGISFVAINNQIKNNPFLNNDKEENKTINEVKEKDNLVKTKSGIKILFGTTTENKTITPLSNQFSFGFQNNMEVENENINKNNSQKAVFGTQKTDIVSKPSFGFQKKDENNNKMGSNKTPVVFGAPKDNNTSFINLYQII